MLRRIVRPVVLSILFLSCVTDQPLAPKLNADVAASSGPPLIVITELMPDPTRVADAAGEWFEVYNAGNTPVDMQNWRIVSGPTGAEQHVIAASVVVAPGGFAVFGNNADAGTNGGLSEQYSYGTAITLNNANTDWLVLKLPDGTVIDSVAYSARSGTTIVPPTFTPSAGISRAALDVAVDNTLLGGGNWANTPVGTTYGLGDRGTPGSGPYTPIVFGGDPVTVTVTPPIGTAVIGQTRGFSAVARDAVGAVSLTTFTWTSSDEAVGTIAANGVATALTEGSSTITAAAANGVSGTATFLVSAPVPASVTIAINSPRQIPVGFVKPAFPTVRDASNGVISPTPPLTWTSSATDIATVDGSGYITGLAEGDATITATTANGVSGSNTITILPTTVPTTAVYGNNLEFGTPADANPLDDILITRPQYALSYNATRGEPNWVAWDLNATQFGPAPRCDCFSPDPSLPAGVYHVIDADYRNGGYDRGHMTMSEDRTTTLQENATTFYLTNVMPQAAENNQGPWVAFEIFANDLARLSGKEVYIVSGGEYGPTPGTLKNEGKVTIPDYTWKVIVVVPAGTGLANVHSVQDLEVIAVRMPNLTTPGVPASAVGIRNRPWQDFKTTVDAIEAATGYDVLALLPDPIERIVEANDHFPVASAGGPYAGVEGTAVAFSAAGSTDPDGDVLTYDWDFGDGFTGTGAAPQHAYGDNGAYTAKVTVTDPFGASAEASVAVTIANAPPAITTLTLPEDPVQVGTPATVGVAFTDPGTLDTHEITIVWGDGTSTTSPTSPTSHAYSGAGLFRISVTVRDDDGASDSRQAEGYIVVFDPAAGKIAGGGWFNAGGNKWTFAVEAGYSPQGRLEGHAELHLVRGSTAFSAAEVSWLAVNGTQAIVRGTGTMTGELEPLQFLIVAREGKPDGVRFKIWRADGTVVFDNQPGQPDDSPAVTSLGGGSLQIVGDGTRQE